MVQRSFEHETGFVSWETKETMLPPSTNYLHIEGNVFFSFFFSIFNAFHDIWSLVLFLIHLDFLFCSFLYKTVSLQQNTHKKCFVRLSWSFFGSFILLDVFTPHEGSARGAN